MSKIYFISDMHFFHKNIIEFCERPFKDVDEMNEFIIKKWNETIKKHDKVFVLGDLGFGSKEVIEKVIKRLKGIKVLVRGNHDHYNDEYYRSIGFKEVINYPIIYKKFFIISHEPVNFIVGTPFLNIHGHIHNNKYGLDERDKIDNSKNNYLNVSVEALNYIPITFEEIKELRGFD